MSEVVAKIKNRIVSVRQTYQNDIRFSGTLARRRLSLTLSGYLRCQTNQKRKLVEDQIRSYLYPICAPVIEELSKSENCCVPGDNAPIWICWWQGEAQAPDLVRQCINSIRAHSGNHPVHMITGENFSDYLVIPEYILEKVRDGRMCIANFSDYLRFSLLEKYGGLWLDTTIFVPHDLPDEYFSKPFFTGNAHRGTGYLSDGRWTSFCMGGWAHNVVFRFMKAAFEEYWKKNDVSIDYLLVDYLLDAGYSTNADIRSAIDAVPLNNQHRNDLAAAMLKGLPGEEFASVVQNDTYIYKLSWREKYPLVNSEGRVTVYSAFLNMNFEG